MKKTAFILGLALLIVGCGKEPPKPIPPPPPAGEVVVVPGWNNLTNAASVKSVFDLGGASSVPAFIAPGAVELPVDFSGKEPPARASWDIRIPCDLSQCDGLQFDFYCDDLAQFSGLSFYCKSGDGWYHGSFEAEDDGVWQRVRLAKSSNVGTEGKVAPWDQVKTLRISGWRAGKGKFRCAMANLAFLGGGKPDVAIVYAQSLQTKGGAESKNYTHFANTVKGTLSALGLNARVVGDNEVTAELLKDAKAVVLPYNPSFPADKLPLLQDYVAAGGRFLACYVLPSTITGLLGVKTQGCKRPGEGTGIAGFLKKGNGLAGMPDFAPQSSWMTEVVASAPDVEVVAEWASGNRKSMGIPALVRTRRGLFMGHVWLGGSDSASLQFMRAVVAELSSELGEKMEKGIAERKQREAELREWLEKRPSCKDDVRAFWCHSARGLGGGRDWDASIKFLKENGFNRIIPNLCWAGVADYQSKVLPVSAEVATKGDAFEQCRAACKKYGVEMHVWKVCWNMGHRTSREQVKKMHDAKRTQVDWKGNEKEQWLCPSHPDNQQLEIDAMVELAKKGPDGIHFDYIRYPSADYCYCNGCRERFEAQLGAKVEKWPADVRDEKKLKGKWNEFRAGNITKVVKTVAERVRKEAPGVKISAALFRNPDSDPKTVAQDWPSWCRDGLLDFACHMDYVASTPSFVGQVKSQLKAAGKVPLYPGLGLSCWPGDGNDGKRMAKQIQAARDLGVKGFTVFNFDRRAEAVLPLMRLGVTKEDPR